MYYPSGENKGSDQLCSYCMNAQLTCVFVFAFADCWFSGAADHFIFILVDAPVSVLFSNVLVILLVMRIAVA